MKSSGFLLLSIVGVAMLWSFMAWDEENEGLDHEVMVHGRPVSDVHGIWRSRGYGYVVSIDQTERRLFHVAGGYCYEDPRSEDEWSNTFTYFRPWSGGALAFSIEPGQTLYIFDKLAALPAACKEQPDWTPSRIGALVAATLTDIYPSFAERGIDWPARRAVFERNLASITTDSELFKALQGLLAGVEDAHLDLRARIDGERRTIESGDGVTLTRVRKAEYLGSNGNARYDKWRRAYRDGIIETILRDKGERVANGRVIWGRVGDIGYINLLAMAGFSEHGQQGREVLDGVLDKAMTAFKGARAVIVDVSTNDGGDDVRAQQIANRFANVRRLAYTKVPYGAQRVEPQPYYVEPSRRPSFTGPVYMVTTDVTLSAGEIFVFLMRALPNVVHIGTTTRGALSDEVQKPLPNGWHLQLPGEIYRDPTGAFYELKGIPAKVEREVFPADDLAGGHTRFVLNLMDEIRRGVR